MAKPTRRRRQTKVDREKFDQLIDLLELLKVRVNDLDVTQEWLDEVKTVLENYRYRRNQHVRIARQTPRASEQEPAR